MFNTHSRDEFKCVYKFLLVDSYFHFFIILLFFIRGVEVCIKQIYVVFITLL